MAGFAANPVHADTASQLKAAEANLNVLIARIGSETRALTALGAQNTALAVEIGHVEDQIAATQARIVALQQTTRAAQYQQQLAQEQLNHRAWVAYETGPGTGIEFLLSSASLSDLSDRMEILNRAALTDTSLIAQIQQWQAVLERKQVQTQRLQAQLQGTEVTLHARQRALLAKVLQAKAILVQLSKDQLAAEQQVRALKIKRRQEIALARLAAAAMARYSFGFPNTFEGYLAWAKVFLPYMNLPTCTNNLVVIVAWETQEGTSAKWNPLDTTLRLPGSTDFNWVGVQNYLSLQQGLQATALTLQLGSAIFGYGRIVSALAACDPPMQTAQQIAASNWCGPVCPPTYVTALIPEIAAKFG